MTKNNESNIPIFETLFGATASWSFPQERECQKIPNDSSSTNSVGDSDTRASGTFIQLHTGDVYLLDVPGCSTADVSVVRDGDVIRISAKSSLGYHDKSYSEIIDISHNYDYAKITALVKNGVLRVSLPVTAPNCSTRSLSVASQLWDTITLKDT